MNRTKLIRLISLGLFLCFSSCQKSEEPYDAPLGYSSPNIRNFSISASLEADEEESAPRWLRRPTQNLLKGRIYVSMLWSSFTPTSMVYLKKEGDPTIYRFRRPVFWKVSSLSNGLFKGLFPYPDMKDRSWEYNGVGRFDTKGKEAALGIGGWELIHADDYKVPDGDPIKPVPEFRKGDKWYAIAAMAPPAAFRHHSTRSQTVDMSGHWFSSDEIYTRRANAIWLSYPLDPNEMFWQMSNWQEFTVAEDNTLHLKFYFKIVSPLVFVTVENQAQDFVFDKGDGGPFEYVAFRIYFGANNVMAGYYDLGAFDESTDVGKRAKWVPTKTQRPFRTVEEVRELVKTNGGRYLWTGVGLALNFDADKREGATFQKGSVQHFCVALPTEMVIDSQQPEEERTLFIQSQYTHPTKIFPPGGDRYFNILNQFDDKFRYKIVVGNQESRLYSALESARIPITSSLIPGRYYKIKIVILPKE